MATAGTCDVIGWLELHSGQLPGSTATVCKIYFRLHTFITMSASESEVNEASQHVDGSMDRESTVRLHQRGPVAHAHEPIIEVINVVQEEVDITNSGMDYTVFVNEDGNDTEFRLGNTNWCVCV